MRPSAPVATPALASGVTMYAVPVPCEGSTITGKCDMRFLDGFSHNLQAELLANGCHNLPAFFAEALERVRRRSRFPNAATKKPRTTLLHCLRDREGLLATLDRARTRDNRQLAVANR